MPIWLKALLTKRMLIVTLLGFSSGLPLLMTLGTLQAWMRDENVSLSTIGLFALVGLPYTLKFIWAPLMDRYIPRFLGRRRGWILFSQVGLVFSIAALSRLDPQVSLNWVALFALLIAFFSASQDIAVDAYRREILTDNELGLGSSLFVNGYRIGMLASGALALFMADQMSWNAVYLVLAGMMAASIFFTLFADEPNGEISAPRTLNEAIIGPFIEYFKRRGAFEILLFILLYKIGDSMASHMTTPFILDVGFTKTEYAAVAKTFGMFATIAGGLLGGFIIVQLGIIRSLWVFAFLQMFSTAGFSILAHVGRHLPTLTGVVAFENLSSGMGTAAYVAYMASLTNRKFTATQYALLSSLMGIPRVIASTPTGYMAESLGWTVFFIICTLAAIPGILMLPRVQKWSLSKPDNDRKD